MDCPAVFGELCVLGEDFVAVLAPKEKKYLVLCLLDFMTDYLRGQSSVQNLLS